VRGPRKARLAIEAAHDQRAAASTMLPSASQRSNQSLTERFGQVGIEARKWRVTPHNPCKPKFGQTGSSGRSR
jgi:hypothetical protein